MKKNFLFSFISFFLIIIIFEFTSRSVIFIFTQNYKIFKYGFDNSLTFQVRKLSAFNFEVIDNNKLSEKLTYKTKKKIKKKLIWVFGGSTSDVACSEENTVSWPSKLNDNNLKVVNFARSGTNTDFALNSLISKINANNIPDTILWANFVNETDVISFGFKRNKFLSSKLNENIEINKLIYFLKSFSKSLKEYSLFYFLMDDLYVRIMNRLKIPITFIDINKKLLLDELRLSSENYYINTSKAIRLSNMHKVKFYIITLFSKNNLLEPDKFNNKEKIFFKKIEKLIKENIEINWINLKKDIYLEKKIIDKIFCDNIHFTTYGNEMVSKMIKKEID